MEPRKFPRSLQLEWTPPKLARRRQRAPRRLPRMQEKVCGVKAVSNCKTCLGPGCYLTGPVLPCKMPWG